MRAYKPPPIPEEIISRMRSLMASGASREELIAEMRRAGLHIVECIKLTRTLYGLTLGEAKETVHCSSAWADCREAHERFHDESIAAMEQDGWTVAEDDVSEIPAAAI